MSRDSAERNGWLERLNPLRPRPQPIRQAPAYRPPPSRETRSAMTTWQDDAAIKELKRLAVELGTTQQALIAEGINMVLAKYAKPTVAT
jgi:hypothetical protein